MIMSGGEPWLRSVTRREFEEWLPRAESRYAEYILASGAMPRAQAQQKARHDTQRAFSAGFDTPGQLVFRVMVGEERVGWLWLAIPAGDADPCMGWVSNVEIEGAFRGRGYGRAAMGLAEQEARSRGMTSIGLNVHGQNTVARSLYDSLGYQVMTQQMRKPL